MQKADYTVYAFLGFLLAGYLLIYNAVDYYSNEETDSIYYNVQEMSYEFLNESSPKGISNKERLVSAWEDSVGTTDGRFTIPQFQGYKSMFEFGDKSYSISIKENDWLLFRNLNPLKSNRGLMLAVVDYQLNLKDISLNIIENTIHNNYVNHTNVGVMPNGWTLHMSVNNESFYLNKALDKDLMVEIFVSNNENTGIVLTEEDMLELANKLSELILVEENTGVYNGFVTIDSLDNIALDNKVGFDLSKLRISGWVSGDDYHSFESYHNNGLKLNVTEYMCRFDEFLSRESIPYRCSYKVIDDITYILAYVDTELTGVVYCNDSATYFVSVADRVSTLTDDDVIKYVTNLFTYE